MRVSINKDATPMLNGVASFIYSELRLKPAAYALPKWLCSL